MAFICSCPCCVRGDDILLPARPFPASNSGRYHKPGLMFSGEAEKIQLNYAGRGNVRALRNAVEEAVLLAPEQVIGADQRSRCATLGGLPPGGCKPLQSVVPVVPGEGLNLEEVERSLALQRTSGKVTRAAKLPGFSRDTPRYRPEKFRLVEHRRNEAGAN